MTIFKTLTVHEAHLKTGISKKEIYRLVQLGIWDSIRTTATSKIHIIEASIEDWQERRRHNAASVVRPVRDPDASLPEIPEPMFS